MQYCLKIVFQDSRSRKFHHALKLAGKFDNFSRGHQNIVDVTMKEVFQKWEYFNMLFWCVVDWQGTILEWERVPYYSHTDKTRIFYALQQAHINHICYLEARIEQLHRVELGLIRYDDLDDVYTDEDINVLLDSYKIVKTQREIDDDLDLADLRITKRPIWRKNNG